MKQAHPGIVDLFPDDREKILKLCVTDVAVGELCEDYDEVLNALKRITRELQAENYHSWSVNELNVLRRELEQELQERLDR